MPWSNDGKDGGSWKPNNPGPWGQPPRPSQADLEEWLRQAQERLTNWLPGGGVGGRTASRGAAVGVGCGFCRAFIRSARTRSAST